MSKKYRLCIFEDCSNRGGYADKYCATHHYRFKRYGDAAYTRRGFHGLSDRSEHVIWQTMKARCYRPTATKYENYGGRGIKICDRWLGQDGFKNFLADMGDRPSKSHSIDRINNDGNYEPENCRWATPSQQAANRRPRSRIKVAVIEDDGDES